MNIGKAIGAAVVLLLPHVLGACVEVSNANWYPCGMAFHDYRPESCSQAFLQFTILGEVSMYMHGTEMRGSLMSSHIGSLARTSYAVDKVAVETRPCRDMCGGSTIFVRHIRFSSLHMYARIPRRRRRVGRRQWYSVYIQSPCFCRSPVAVEWGPVQCTVSNPIVKVDFAGPILIDGYVGGYVRIGRGDNPAGEVSDDRTSIVFDTTSDPDLGPSYYSTGESFRWDFTIYVDNCDTGFTYGDNFFFLSYVDDEQNVTDLSGFETPDDIFAPANEICRKYGLRDEANALSDDVCGKHSWSRTRR